MCSKAIVLASITRSFHVFIHPINVNIMGINMPSLNRIFSASAARTPNTQPAPAQAQAQQVPQGEHAQHSRRGWHERARAFAMRTFAAPSSAQRREFETQLREWVNSAPESESENRAKAAKRIDDARLYKQPTLDLSNLDLTMLPECVGMLAALRKLMLKDSQRTSLPESVRKNKNLVVTSAPLPERTLDELLPMRNNLRPNGPRAQASKLVSIE